jgi:hypothetical protein
MFLKGENRLVFFFFWEQKGEIIMITPVIRRMQYFGKRNLWRVWYLKYTIRSQFVYLKTYLKQMVVWGEMAIISAILIVVPILPNKMVVEKQIEKQPVILANLTLDPQLVEMVRVDRPEAKYTLGISSFEQERQDKINSRKRLVLARDIPVQVNRYKDPVDFRPIYQAAGQRFNIPWQVLEAVHQVESGKSGSSAKRSYAGATGPMQFLPSTFRHYAIDGNGDGQLDITNVEDAIYAAANLLASNGAAEGRIEQALFCYNHSMSYVQKVLGIAQEIGYQR